MDGQEMGYRIKKMDYRTYDDDQIIFVVYDPDPEDQLGQRNGFVVSRIDAYVRPKGAPPILFEDEYLGEYVGFLKISYVPRENWERLITSPWEHAQRWEGKFSGADVSSIDALYEYFRRWHTSRPPVEETTPEQRLRVVEQEVNLEQMESHMAADYAYHVDKPLVDYIRVLKPWQRRGIALALYDFGAWWLANDKGFRLYASGIQSDTAKAVWDRMEQDPAFPTGREWYENISYPQRSKERRYLDYTGFDTSEKATPLV